MSLAATLTRSLRERYNVSNVDKNEVRPSQYGAWNHFVEQSANPSGILSNDLKEKIERSFGNSVEIPVLDADDVTISNVRSCTIAEDNNTSALMSLTFATYAFGFTMLPVDYYNNEIDYQSDYDRKLEKYLLKLASEFDTKSIAQFEADKNQFAAGLADFYPVVGDSLQVPQAEKEDFYNQLSSIKDLQDFYSQIDVIHNPAHGGLVRRLDNQGSYNGTNQAFQFDPYTFKQSNRLANGLGVQSTGFAVSKGNAAVHYRLDPDALMRKNIGTKEWDTVQMPIVNIPMGSYYTVDCADRSAIVGGANRSVREGFEFSVDLCWFTSYNSDPVTRYSPVQKFEIMS